MKLETLEPLAALDRAATVVVYNIAQRDELRDRIHRQLGDERASQTTIVVIADHGRAMAHLSGRKAPIFIALEFYALADDFLIDLVEAYAGHANARPRDTKLERSTRD